MLSFHFWNKWLLTVSFLLIVFGFFLILFNQSALFNYVFAKEVNSVFWPNGIPAEDINLFQQWIYGILGAVMVGWGTFLTFITTHAFRNKERWSFDCIALGITLWFIADTALSLYFHVYINVFLNAVIFIAIGLPLIFTKKYFI